MNRFRKRRELAYRFSLNPTGWRRRQIVWEGVRPPNQHLPPRCRSKSRRSTCLTLWRRGPSLTATCAGPLCDLLRCCVFSPLQHQLFLLAHPRLSSALFPALPQRRPAPQPRFLLQQQPPPRVLHSCFGRAACLGQEKSIRRRGPSAVAGSRAQDACALDAHVQRAAVAPLAPRSYVC